MVEKYYGATQNIKQCANTEILKSFQQMMRSQENFIKKTTLFVYSPLEVTTTIIATTAAITHKPIIIPTEMHVILGFFLQTSNTIIYNRN